MMIVSMTGIGIKNLVNVGHGLEIFAFWRELLWLELLLLLLLLLQGFSTHDRRSEWLRWLLLLLLLNNGCICILGRSLVVNNIQFCRRFRNLERNVACYKPRRAHAQPH